MKIINLDELVILGPGSEWLWTMVSGLVLAITFYAIYRQLSLQRDAVAIEQVRQIYREWTDERMSRAKLDCLTGLRDGRDAQATLLSGTEVADFWEGLAYLVRAGNMDRKLVYNSLGPAVRIWWSILAPSARLVRQQAEDQGIWVDFEWLAGVFAEFDRKANEPAAYDEAYVARRIPEMIETNRQAIRAFEELRAVIVRAASPATLTQGKDRRRRATTTTTAGAG